MSSDLDTIKRMIQAWNEALMKKDMDGLVQHYRDDSHLFDGIPPYKTVGKDAIRQLWANCLPYFPEKFLSEHQDLQITVNGDMAFAHGLHHFVPEDKDHPCGFSWMRITVCYQRIEGKWWVVHEHVSLPFNPMDNQVWLIKDPTVLDMPDWSAEGGES